MVRLQGARITGELDLSDADLGTGLGFFQCTFEAPPGFSRAKLRVLTLSGSVLPGLDLDQASIETNLVLIGAKISGTAGTALSLAGATIGGQLNLTGADLRASNAPALVADGATIGDNLTASGLSVRSLGASDQLRVSE